MVHGHNRRDIGKPPFGFFAVTRLQHEIVRRQQHPSDVGILSHLLSRDRTDRTIVPVRSIGRVVLLLTISVQFVANLRQDIAVAPGCAGARLFVVVGPQD